jgi:hypothetical protein
VIAVVWAAPLTGVAVTVMVYIPIVVPGLPLMLILLGLPQLVPTAMTAKINIASNTRPRRFCAEIPSRKKQAMNAPTSLTKNKFGPSGRLLGRKTADVLGVVETVIVALPVIFAAVPAVKLMMFGAVKFESGTPKALQVGGSSAPIGEVVTAQVKVTLSALTMLDPVTVIRSVLDCPGEVIVKLLEAGDRLIPAVLTFIETAVVVVLAV